VTFDPSTLGGKLLWLRAKDLTAGTVTSWPDQSGHGMNNATGSETAVAGSTPLGGMSVLMGSVHFSFSLSTALQAITATASSNAGAGWLPAFAFDGVPGGIGSAWASAGGAPAWLQAQVPTAVVSTGYTIQGRTDDTSQTPTAWTFLGSNDGSAWTTLDTRTGQTFTAGQFRHFTFTNSVAYSYYRINVTANNGGSNVAISDLFIDGINPQAVATQAEVWAVIKATAAATGWSRFSAAGFASHYPYSDGNVYEGFGGTSRQSFTPTLAVSSWRIYRVSNDGTTWQAWLDGVSQATVSSVPVSIEPSGTLGYSSYIAGEWVGNVAEILVRTQVSTTQEVSDITAYLTAEHFVAAPAQPLFRRPTIVASRAAQRASRW